ncbi:unnamed protein product [Lathyrus sativus]|nr:unnamed protein product [Lathyrus sativus]
MSILVNKSLTKDFEVGRGLRSGDSLSLFLFVLVADVLTSMISKASERGNFEGFRDKEGLLVEIIQFSNDTLIIGEGGWKNLWNIKAILRGFKLVSGLSVSFLKSRIIGIHLSKHFLDVATNFLLCKIEDPCFNFLGIPIGYTPASSFSDLFDISNKKGDFVINMGVWLNGKWSWGDIGIPREMQNSVSKRINFLQNLLSVYQPIVGTKNFLQWIRDDCDEYSTREGYECIMDSKNQDMLETVLCRAFNSLWRLLVLTKIKSFGWRIFLKRMATKDQLKRIGVGLSLKDGNFFLFIV